MKFVIALLLTSVAAPALSLPLDSLNLPDGYSIEVYAEVPNARQMAQGPDGVIYVGTRRDGRVFAVVDHNDDYEADEVIELDADLNLPSGVTYKNGDLYVGAVSEILVYENIDKQLASPPEPIVLIGDLPTERHHGWKFIDFGPDGHLYVPVGAPCNICLSDDPRYASIIRYDLEDLTKPEIVANGVRNTVGFDWHPKTGHLWFTDNGRDNLGDESPACELNELQEPGQHFGYPFFHADGISDPEFAAKANKAQSYIEPALNLGPHVAPLGILFYTGSMLPGLSNQVLIAEHGSWNRTPEAGHTGYRVTVGREDSGEMFYEVLIDGWLEDSNEAWGRPVDFLQLKDGSVLLSDDKANVIYRMTYSK